MSGQQSDLVWVAKRNRSAAHLAPLDGNALCGMLRPKKGWPLHWEGLADMQRDGYDFPPHRVCELRMMGVLD